MACKLHTILSGKPLIIMSRSRKKDYPKKFDSRRFDHSCRNHGGCGYCVNNRTFFDAKSRAKADLAEQEKDFYNSSEAPDSTDESGLPPA